MFDLSRSDWGARNPNRGYNRIAMDNRPGVEGHHSVGTYGASTAAAFARSVQQDHLGRNWIDVFYNVGIWPEGEVIELRPATALSNNIRDLTVVLAGNFERRKPTTEMKRSLVRVRDAARERGVGARVRWHAQRGGTSCPGARGIDLFRNLADLSLEPQELGDRVIRLRDDYMRGDDVKKLQEMLNVFLSYRGQTELAEDGIFGPKSAEAASLFMDKRMDVQTNDPRVGPRTVEKLEIFVNKEDRGEPDYVVAVCADNEIDEGIALTMATGHWRFLRYPEEVKDYSIGTLVAVGASANKVDDDSSLSIQDRVAKVAGSDRYETAAKAKDCIRNSEFQYRKFDC